MANCTAVETVRRADSIHRVTMIFRGFSKTLNIKASTRNTGRGIKSIMQSHSTSNPNGGNLSPRRPKRNRRRHGYQEPDEREKPKEASFWPANGFPL